MASLPGTEKTILLYQTDGTLTTHNSTLTTLTPLSTLPPSTTSLFKPPPADPQSSPPYILTTPSTIFHAQGGGQPSDIGTIVAASTSPSAPVFHVHQARTVDATVLHMGVFAPADARFPPDTDLQQSIDSAKRRLHSRLHTAGHALGCAVAALVAAGELPADIVDGKASHYPGAAFVEYVGLIPSAAKDAIQGAVDALVARDLEVEVAVCSEEQARAECLGIGEGFVMKQGEDGVRVVRFGDAGAYPCGGTHVQRLGEVGRVVVRNIKRQKGITKVSYEVQES